MFYHDGSCWVRIPFFNTILCHNVIRISRLSNWAARVATAYEMLNAFLKLFHDEASELVFNYLIELAFLIESWYLYHPDLRLMRCELGISLDLIAHLLEVL